METTKSNATKDKKLKMDIVRKDTRRTRKEVPKHDEPIQEIHVKAKPAMEVVVEKEQVEIEVAKPDIDLEESLEELAEEIIEETEVKPVIEPKREVKIEPKPLKAPGSELSHNNPVKPVTQPEEAEINQAQIHNSTRRSRAGQDLVVSTNPKSSFAEAIKSIKTNILFSSVDKKLKTILVSSPRPGDGKSFTIANLAAAFGQDGKSVLIIDADLRKGRQHNIFGVINNPKAGYSNLIINFEEQRTLEETFEKKIRNYIIATDIENVCLLPNGPTPPNPLELIASETNSKIINILREYFDIILFDCPPVLGLSDTIVMTRNSDANVLVISSRKTKSEELLEAQKAFEKANTKISGIVLNKVKSKETSYSSYYTSKYYSN